MACVGLKPNWVWCKVHDESVDTKKKDSIMCIHDIDVQVCLLYCLALI